METIAKTLDVPKEQASSYFSLTSKLWHKYGIYDLEQRRSEWVLAMHTGITLILATFVWSGILIFYWSQAQTLFLLVIPICCALLSLFLGIRLFRIANREREKSDQDFLIILKKNKTVILDSWKLNFENKDRVDEV